MQNSDATAGHRWYLQMILCAKLYLVVCDSLCLPPFLQADFFARRFEDVTVGRGGRGARLLGRATCVAECRAGVGGCAWQLLWSSECRQCVPSRSAQLCCVLAAGWLLCMDSLGRVLWCLLCVAVLHLSPAIYKEFHTRDEECDAT